MTKIKPRTAAETKELLGKMGLARLAQGRHTQKFKLNLVKRYLDGVEGRQPLIGLKRLADSFAINKQSLTKWIRLYQKSGKDALRDPVKKMAPFSWPHALTPRDVATIRYGMPEFTHAQVAAYYGKSAQYIRMIRTGRAGGPMLHQPVMPVVRSLEEAYRWFLRRELDTIAAYTKSVAALEKGKVKDAQAALADADPEPARNRRPLRGERRTSNRALAAERARDRLEEAGRSDVRPHHGLRPDAASDPWQLPNSEGPHRPRNGTGEPVEQPAVPGLIVRRRR
jgi:transposase-like protein